MPDAWRARIAGGETYFKFIGGANLRDLPTVERLGTLYALAGAALIDVAAEPEVVEAALRGIRRARLWRETRPDWLLAAWGGDVPPDDDPVVMVSITLTGDRHTEIAVVEDVACVKCDRCTPVCPPASIVNGVVADVICTGCGLCLPVCPTECITLEARATDPDVEACWDAGARALEVHTGAADAGEVRDVGALTRAWQARGGLLAYSLDGKQLGYPKAIALARAFGAPGVILQADGKPISGTSGERSTVPAVRLARAFLRERTGAWVQPAGGANDLTGPLAARFGIAISGVGMGSFARRAAKALEAGEDSPGSWREAVMAARALVHSVSASGVATARLHGPNQR